MNLSLGKPLYHEITPAAIKNECVCAMCTHSKESSAVVA